MPNLWAWFIAVCFDLLIFDISCYCCSDKCSDMNSLIVHKIEIAILENAEIIKLYGDRKLYSHASVGDNTSRIGVM